MSEPRSACARRRAGRPAAVLALGAAALAVALVPRAAEALQLDRALVAREPWRILTSHLTHFSVGHLAYDLAVFLSLGLVCESRWPRRTRASLGAALLACSAAMLAGAPELDTYRGLSGLGSALFMQLAARLHVEGAFRSTWARTLPALAVACFLAKLAYEVQSGSAYFVRDAGLFVPVPSAHLAGGMLGLVAGAWPHGARATRRALPSRAQTGA